MSIIYDVELIPSNITNNNWECKESIWLRSAKRPMDGEVLGDEGFDKTCHYFARFNRVRFAQTFSL